MSDSIKLKFGFWNFNLNFWKGNSFRYDDARIFDTKVLIVDTSTLNPEYYSMPSKEKKEIRNHWINALPLLYDVEYLMTTHQIDQEFFDSICKMKNLKGLYIKWGKIDNTSNIKNLENLEHLYFGSNPRFNSLDGFEALKKLNHIELENFKAVFDFTTLRELTNLKTLSITGSISGPSTPINDLYFLNNLNKIQEIAFDISLKNKDVSPLYRFSKMERLFLPSSLDKKLRKELSNK